MPENRNRKQEGVYFVVVDGVPRHCQWQELKDYLRDFVKVRPGHTNVIKLNEDGTRVGYCPLANKNEAYRAFDYLVAEGWQGLDIRVSVIWKLDLHSQEIQRKRGPEPSRRKRLQVNVPPMVRLQSGTHHSPSTASPLAYNMDLMTRSLSNMSIPINNGHLEPRSYSVALPGPTYPTDSSRHGGQAFQYYTSSANHMHQYDDVLPNFIYPPTFQTHKHYIPHYRNRQSIHISRLRHDIKSSQLKQLLARYGHVSDITIMRGREKRCSATARYQTPTEALLAIHELNGRLVEGIELVVRHDRSEDGSQGSSTPSTGSRGSGDSHSKKSSNSSNSTEEMFGRHQLAKPSHHTDLPSSELACAQNHTHMGPLVVNGAQGTNQYRRRKRACSDDDSEGADDSSDEGAVSGVVRRSKHEGTHV